jgi:hypothetical protein
MKAFLLRSTVDTGGYWHELPPFCTRWSLAILAPNAYAAGGSCPRQTMKQIDDVNRRAAMRGSYAVIDAAECDGTGNVSLLVIRRLQDAKIERWRPENGPIDLLRKYVGEQAK